MGWSRRLSAWLLQLGWATNRPSDGTKRPSDDPGDRSCPSRCPDPTDPRHAAGRSPLRAAQERTMVDGLVAGSRRRVALARAERGQLSQSARAAPCIGAHRRRRPSGRTRCRPSGWSEINSHDNGDILREKREPGHGNGRLSGCVPPLDLLGSDNR